MDRDNFEHTESKDCWCKPDIEYRADGTLIIHKNAFELAQERDAIMRELADHMGKYGVICERGHVMQLVRPGKYQCEACADYHEMRRFQGKFIALSSAANEYLRDGSVSNRAVLRKVLKGENETP